MVSLQQGLRADGIHVSIGAAAPLVRAAAADGLLPAD